MSSNRGRWVRALMTHPLPEIYKLRDRCSRTLRVRSKVPVESGLGLLRLREAALGHIYYLGEFPISTAHVELVSPNGRSGEGAAQVMEDNADLALALAILDGVLAHRFEGYREVESFIRQGLVRLEQEQTKREGMLSRTQVDFSLLSEVEAPND